MRSCRSRHIPLGIRIVLVAGLCLGTPARAQMTEASQDVVGRLAEDDWLFDEEDDGEDEPGLAFDADPLEPGNRVVFAMNERIYDWVLDPLADIYEWTIPRPVRSSVRRFFDNLNEPTVVLNDLIRGEGSRAATSGARFAINSTVGVAGLFDPAGHWGFEGHRADFGETLAFYGVGGGPYLIIPVVGPSTARDLVGGVFDAVLRPDAWLLAAGPLVVVATGDGLTRYENQRRQIEELRESSLDFYVALRSAYRMDREARIRAARERGEPVEDPDLSEIPPPPNIR